jgi:hypothetical protein
MRICIILMILLALAGCSRKHPTEHHILPVGFSGVYKIEKAGGPSGGYKREGNRYVFTIPESGVIRVASDAFETHCLQRNKPLSVTFEDGQEIPFFSPATGPPSSEPNGPLWLGLFRSKTAVWCAVGTHDQLSRFLEQVRGEMYQNLERYLPPNMPFHIQGQMPKEARRGIRQPKHTPEELVSLYRRAVTCWDKSMAMGAELVHSYEYRGKNKTDIRHWKYETTHRRDGDRCEWFGHQEFRGEFNGNAMSFNEQFKILAGDDFFLYYRKRDNKEEPSIYMAGDVEELLFTVQAQGNDGGFLLGRMGGIGPAAKMAEMMSESNSLKLIGQETLSGSLCHIVEAKTKYGTYTAWIAPERGYNALKYTVSKSGRDILRDDIRIEDQGITEWVEIVDSIDVQKIDGVFVPISGKLAVKAKAGNEWESTDKVEVKCSDIVLDPDFEALGAFRITLPEGTEVTHEDIPGRRSRWADGKFVPDMNKYLIKSLAGKLLPSFDDMMTGFDLKDTTGKMVLVRFWDMNQRPSRNCIQQLGKQSHELKAKDVSTIAIQASEIDEDELNEWIEENHIPFPVGMIRGNEEEIRATWVVILSICSLAARSESETKAEDNFSVSWSSVTYSRTLQNPKISPSIQIPKASEIVSLDIEVAITDPNLVLGARWEPVIEEIPDVFSVSSDDWLTLTESLAERILDRLDIEPAESERDTMGHWWTRSAEAVDSYARAVWLQEVGRPQTELETEVRTGIEADPNCAMFYGFLAAALRLSR